MVAGKRQRRGVVELRTADGKTVTLKFGTNAICAIEEALNKDLSDILEEMSEKDVEGKPKKVRISMRTIRTMVQHSVVGDPMSPAAIGELIDDVGLANVTKAFGAVFEDAEGSANPPLSVVRAGASDA